ncbi:hypothetical protein B0G38_002584 [Arthrobacter sp. VKM Ac-2550]|nr:hypothetical protein [Arthrobacter sp. VKM Ac-2550]
MSIERPEQALEGRQRAECTFPAWVDSLAAAGPYLEIHLDAFPVGSREVPATSYSGSLSARLLSQIARVDRSVHALGPAMAANREPTSPQLARSLQAEVNVWKRIEDEFSLLSSSEVAEMLGASPNNRNLASEKRRAGKILAVGRGNTFRYPGFQFDRRRGIVRPVIEELIALAAEADWPQEDLLLWLCSPSAYFHEADRPVDHLSEPERLLEAAKAQFEAAW